MKIVLAAATLAEIKPFIDQTGLQIGVWQKQQKVELFILITGIGSPATAIELSALLARNPIDLLLNIGIAGTYNSNLALGSLTEVIAESLPIGAWEQETIWNDHFDQKLTDPNSFPYTEKYLLPVTSHWKTGLPKVKAITIQQIETIPERITALQQHYNADVESMEGAAIFFASQKFQVPAMQIRAISNLCGVRDKQQWQLKEAVQALNNWLLTFLNQW